MQHRDTEERFRLVVEACPSGMLIADDAGAIVLVNAKIEQMFGYTRDELIGRPVDILVPANIRDRHIDIRRQYTIAPKTRIMGAGRDLRGVRKDGTEFPVEIGLNPVRTDEGLLVVSVIVDISERKHAEQALLNSERQYYETFEAAPVAMCWISTEGRYLRTNRAFQILSGYSAEELSHMGPADTSHPDTLVQTRQRMTDLSLGKIDHVQSETKFLHKDKRTLWLWANIVMIRGRDGVPDYLLAHLQDVTARKTAEEQLFHAQKMEAVGNFAGGIAHDFNNMLVPIIGLTEMTKDDLPADSPLQENLDLVLDAATKARDLVRQILTFSRQDEMAASAVDLSAFTLEALGLLRNMLPATIALVQSIPPDIGIVMANSAQLQSIIMNLGSNAAAAIGDRIGELRIGLSRVQIGDARTPRIAGLANGVYGRLYVADSGKGMDEATLAKIFDPFFTTKGPGEGTGLGLSMVHGIVERCGGAIDVASRVGVGTRFDIYLPLLDAAKDAKQIV